MIGQTVLWIYCVAWAGHDAYIVPDVTKPVDPVYCRRCLARQGERGWYNIGALKYAWNLVKGPL